MTKSLDVQVANFLMPYYAEYWGDTMKNLKLEIDNDNVDPSTPVGIGNLAGQALHCAHPSVNPPLAAALFAGHLQPRSCCAFCCRLHSDMMK